MGGCSLRWCYSHLISHPPGRRGDLALVLVVGSQAWILLLAPPFITANNCKAFCSRSVLRKRDRVKSFCRAVVAVRQNLCEYLSRVYLYAVNKKELPILCKPWFWTWWIVRCFFFLWLAEVDQVQELTLIGVRDGVKCSLYFATVK